MTTWKKAAHQLGYTLESHFDQLRYRFKRQLQFDRPLQIVPYASFGNLETLYVKGRVLEDAGNIDQQDEESLWDNLVAAYRRFESDEVPHQPLIASIQQVKAELKTDDEGYFNIELPCPATLDTRIPWHNVSIEIPEQPGGKPSLTEAVTAKVLVPEPDCDFGIISDIDDTIMVTNATSLLKMAQLTFLHSPASRLPFQGVGEFYQALTRGTLTQRPIFYVSSSPWNLYDFLVEFMAINGIPNGPLLLRDFGLEADRLFQSSHHQHKLAQITQVMDTYPQLSFILIGDSGQHDPEIYTEVVASRPQQVRAIYIRDVSENPQRDEEVRKLDEQTQKHNIDLLLVSDTLAAAQHAVSKGYIEPAAMHQIEAAFADNKPAANPVEEALEAMPEDL